MQTISNVIYHGKMYRFYTGISLTVEFAAGGRETGVQLSDPRQKNHQLHRAKIPVDNNLLLFSSSSAISPHSDVPPRAER